MSESLYDERVGERYVDQLREMDRQRDAMVQKILDVSLESKQHILLEVSIEFAMDNPRHFIRDVIEYGFIGYEKMSGADIEEEWKSHLQACYLDGPPETWLEDDITRFYQRFLSPEN